MTNLARILMKVKTAALTGLVLLAGAHWSTEARAQSGSAPHDDALAHGVIRPAAPKSQVPVGSVHQIAVDSRPPFYSPAELTIHVGDVVEWSNPERSDSHTVYGAAGEFFSPLIPPGTQWCRQFTREGDYSYSCRIHPWMHAVVHVLADDVAMRHLPLPKDMGMLTLEADGGELWLRSKTALFLVRESGGGGEMKIVRRISIPPSPQVVFDNRGNAWLQGPHPGTVLRVSLGTGVSQLVRTPGLAGPLSPLAAVVEGGGVWAVDLQRRQLVLVRFGDAKIDVRLPASSVAWDGPVLASSDGSLWILSKRGTSLLSFNAHAGEPVEYHLGEGAQIAALREGSHGAIWAADAGRGKLLKIENRWTTEYTVPGGYSSPVDLSQDSRGWIWFAEKEASKIGVLRPDGTFAEYRTPAATTGPRSLRFDQKGNLWFMEGRLGSLGQISSATLALLDQPASFDLPACTAMHPSNAGNNHGLGSAVPGRRGEN